MSSPRHAVARLRAERRARGLPPARVRGCRVERCPECRVPRTHCLCAWCPRVPTRAGMCLLMHDVEPLKPSNTGWLVADVVPDTAAFAWTRTEVDPRLPALLDDPQWQPYVVFPGANTDRPRVVRELDTAARKRPLFVLLDATWPEAQRMFRKSPYLERFPVLDVQPAQGTRYLLRRAVRDGQLCTAEAAAACLQLSGDERAARALEAWLEVFVARSLEARFHRALVFESEAHTRLKAFL